MTLRSDLYTSVSSSVSSKRETYREPLVAERILNTKSLKKRISLKATLRLDLCYSVSSSVSSMRETYREPLIVETLLDTKSLKKRISLEVTLRSDLYASVSSSVLSMRETYREPIFIYFFICLSDKIFPIIKPRIAKLPSESVNQSSLGSITILKNVAASIKAPTI